ncbi:PIN domain-containing protein [Candidatus Undinarchaeota archaeon]
MVVDRLYLDTHIWIDYWLNRRSGLNPIGDFASRLISETIACKYKIFISEVVCNELESLRLSEPIVLKQLFAPLIAVNKLRQVPLILKQKQEARRISFERNIPYGDALHAILSRDNEAILISRDKHHTLTEDIVHSAKPEDLI